VGEHFDTLETRDPELRERAIFASLPAQLAYAKAHTAAGDLGRLPHPRLAYPSLRLARRALPVTLGEVDLSGLERQVPDRLARWAASVRLDASCGLTTGRPPDAPAGIGARWERWRPDRWRMLVAYGDAPLPAALGRHGLTVAGRVRRRA
jgi:phenylacetate-CoA ligase